MKLLQRPPTDAAALHSAGRQNPVVAAITVLALFAVLLMSPAVAEAQSSADPNLAFAVNTLSGVSDDVSGVTTGSDGTVYIVVNSGGSSGGMYQVDNLNARKLTGSDATFRTNRTADIEGIAFIRSSGDKDYFAVAAERRLPGVADEDTSGLMIVSVTRGQLGSVALVGIVELGQFENRADGNRGAEGVVHVATTGNQSTFVVADEADSRNGSERGVLYEVVVANATTNPTLTSATEEFVLPSNADAAGIARLGYDGRYLVVSESKTDNGGELYVVDAGLDDVVFSAPIPSTFTQPEGIHATVNEIYLVGERNQIAVINRSALFPPEPASPEVTYTVSCIGHTGRIDANFVNASDKTVAYEQRIGHLTRAATAKPWGDARVSVTGRPNGDYTLVSLRNGVEINRTTANVSCAGTPSLPADQPEVTARQFCKNGRGMILFQFANDSAAAKPYVVRFERPGMTPLSNSTTAAAFGASVRGVSGRSNGQYWATIVSGAEVVYAARITVDC